MLKKRVAHNATNGSPKTAYHTKRTRRVVKYSTSVFIKNHTFQRVTRIKQPGAAGVCTRLMDNEAKNNPSPIPGHPQNRHTLNGWANPKRIAKIFQCRREQSEARVRVPTLILNVPSSHPRHFHLSSPTFPLCHARPDRASSVFRFCLVFIRHPHTKNQRPWTLAFARVTDKNGPSRLSCLSCLSCLS